MSILPAVKKNVYSLAVERALPAQMMLVMHDQCKEKGLAVLRDDVLSKLQMAAVAPLARLDELGISRCARMIDAHSTALLHDLSPDDPRDGLYCCAMFCLALVDEGRLDDKTNMAVLVSLLLIDDARDRKPDAEGQLAPWKLDEPRWKAKAKELIRAANALNLFLTDNPTIVRGE